MKTGSTINALDAEMAEKLKKLTPKPSAILWGECWKQMGVDSGSLMKKN
jgi:hypothetical protein